MIWILVLNSIIKILFSGYLLAFHIFVNCKGLTTYQYVLKSRAKKVRSLNSKTEKLKEMFNEAINDSSSNERISLKTLEDILKEEDGDDILQRVIQNNLQNKEGVRINTEMCQRDMQKLITLKRKSRKDRQSQMYKIRKSKFLRLSHDATNHEGVEE